MTNIKQNMMRMMIAGVACLLSGISGQAAAKPLKVSMLIGFAGTLCAAEPAPVPPDLTQGGKKDANHDWTLGPPGCAAGSLARRARPPTRVRSW